jgi:hypothetical protein
VDRELCPLGLDEAPLEEVDTEPALDRVPGDHANDDGREKEEVVVDEDLDRRRLQPYGHDLVADYDGQTRPRGIGKPELQHGVCPRYDEKEPCVIEVAGRRVRDGDHRHDAQSGEGRHAGENGLHDRLEPAGERQTEHDERGGAEDRVPDQPYPSGCVWNDKEVKNPEQRIKQHRQDKSKTSERQRMLKMVLRKVGLEIVSEPEAACREDRGPDPRRPGHFPYLTGCGRGGATLRHRGPG